MVRITYAYIGTVLVFYGHFSKYPSLLLRSMFEHDCLDTCCFACLICMRSLFLCLHLFRAMEYVSLGKALKKYANYYD